MNRQVIKLADEFDKYDKEKEIDDFFQKFDKISDAFDKSLNKSEGSETVKKADLEIKNSQLPENQVKSSRESSSISRLERLAKSKPQSRLTKTKSMSDSRNQSEENMTKRKKRKKYSINKKKLFKFIFLTGLCIFLILCGIVVSIIVKTPSIEPDNIYSRLSENSTLYDDSGNVIDSILTADGLRTNVSYTDLPDNLINAFVSIEDKTFWDHHGFNFIRILGAIKEGILQGDNISGTSTITQQLARNLYLAETKSDYSFTRKIKEAYYTVLLERHLSKEQIIEAYLNTIFLGYGTNGVEAASQAYFSKDVQDLTLVECAALASLPKAPDTYALVKRYNTEQITDDTPNIIRKGDVYTLVYNDTVTDRKNLVLSFMLAQNKITQTQYDEAMAVDLKDSINPSEDTTAEISSYFADYVIDSVVTDLMEEYNLTESEAKQKIYNSGLQIYTTMDSDMQKIAEKEFSDNSNFPKVTDLKKDSAGNVLNSNGNVLLYSYNHYFDSDGTFVLSPNEYTVTADGGISLLKGHRLNFYKTEVQGKIDYSVEFKDMYVIEDNIFYCIKGGVISIPQEYKTRDEDGNLVISGSFFEDYPDFFKIVSTGMSLSNKHYSLKQHIVQPQSAMVIFDYETGGIKAMVGGRNIQGRLLFNRATSPRQPGSSIKPMAVYAPALETGLKKAAQGISNGTSEGNSYGDLWTAASVIDDAPLTIQGKLWPKNWYNGYHGLYTMRESLEQSVNVNAVKIFTNIGASTSLEYLKKFGITSIVEEGSINDMNAAALALGGMSKGVSPLEMVAGYGTFPNQGEYTEPISYTSVTNKQGEVILEKTPSTSRVLDSGIAFIMTDLLRSTVSDGIAGSAAIGTQPVAGKTGTTSDNYDAWFVGFTPQYAASVWIGNDVNIELSQGSVAAAKLWSKVMKQAVSGLDRGSFPSAPSNVISVNIDTKSGRLPSELSALDPRGSTIRSEYFIKGTEPNTTDNVHVAAEICSDSGYLATPYCTNTVSKVFVKRPYTADSNVADYIYELPAYYCNLHNPDASKYPINPSETLNTDFVWNNDSDYNEWDAWDKANGNSSGNNDSGAGNTNTNNQNTDNTDGSGNGNTTTDDGSEPPAWLNFNKD